MRSPRPGEHGEGGVGDPVGCPLPGASLLLGLTSALVALVQKDQANLEVRHE